MKPVAVAHSAVAHWKDIFSIKLLSSKSIKANFCTDLQSKIGDIATLQRIEIVFAFDFFLGSKGSQEGS